MNKATLRAQLPLLVGPGILNRAEVLLAEKLAVRTAGGNLRSRVGSARGTLVCFNLDVSSNDIDYACDCALGAEEIFCEHCAMLALFWLNQPDDVTDITVLTDPCTSVSPDSESVNDKVEGSLLIHQSAHLFSADESARRSANEAELQEITTLVASKSREQLVEIILSLASADSRIVNALHQFYIEEQEAFLKDARLISTTGYSSNSAAIDGVRTR